MNTKVLQNLSKQHYVALVLAVAILAWSVALPAFFKVHGHDTVSPAPVNLEVILSDATPGYTATHTIKFNISEFATTTDGIDSIVVSYDATDTEGLNENFDVNEATLVETTGTGGAKLGTLTGIDGQSFRIAVSGTETLAPDDVFTIVVSGIVNPNHTLGTEAVGSGGVNDKIDAASHVVNVDMQDATESVASSDTRVTIISSVKMTAAVDTIFTFSVAGLNEGFLINGRNTSGTSTPTSFDFGTIVHDTEYFLGHELRVQTNASNGFVVTIQETQELTSSTGEMIHRFRDTAAGEVGTAAPIAWEAPAATLDEYHTYGHYGITTTDAELGTTTNNTDDNNFADGERFVGNFQQEPRPIFGHTGPTLGEGAEYEHSGWAHVGVALQISSLQPAGDDYTNTLTYVATPTF